MTQKLPNLPNRWGIARELSRTISRVIHAPQSKEKSTVVPINAAKRNDETVPGRKSPDANNYLW